MHKILFCCPTYGPIDPKVARHQRASIMNVASRGVPFAGDLSPDRMLIQGARNAVVERAIKLDNMSDDDGIFWVDSDILLTGEALYKISQRGFDFCSGVYYQRGGVDHWPLFGNLTEKNKMRFGAQWEEGALLEADGCGFGCCWTSMRLLRTMQKRPGFIQWFPHMGVFEMGEDLSFCVQAKMAGCRLMVDTTVELVHLGDPEEIDRKSFTKAHPEYAGTYAPTNGDHKSL